MDLSYQEVIDRIQKLSVEQQQMYRMAGQEGLTAEQRSQLHVMRATLQQLWEERKRMRTHLRDPLSKLVEWREDERAA